MGFLLLPQNKSSLTITFLFTPYKLVKTILLFIITKKKIQTNKYMIKFRISAKKLFLTYSQVNKQLTALHILEQLQSKKNLKNFQYGISKEYHKDEGTHFHVIIIQNKKGNIRNPKALDIQYQEQAFHGNYTPVKSLRHAIA